MVNEKFEWSLQALAQPAKSQIRLFPEFVNVADELALAWEEVIEDEDLSILNKEQKRVVAELDDYIVSISGKKNEELWTHEALTNSVEWARVRKLANEVIESLGWKKVNPKSAEWATYVAERGHP